MGPNVRPFLYGYVRTPLNLIGVANCDGIRAQVRFTHALNESRRPDWRRLLPHCKLIVAWKTSPKRLITSTLVQVLDINNADWPCIQRVQA